jgi:hypothetical protein
MSSQPPAASEKMVKLCETDRKGLFMLESHLRTSGVCAYCREENASKLYKRSEIRTGHLSDADAARFNADMDADEASAKAADDLSAALNAAAAKQKELALKAEQDNLAVAKAENDARYEAAVAVRKADNVAENVRATPAPFPAPATPANAPFTVPAVPVKP